MIIHLCVYHSKEKKLNKNEFKQNNVTSKELLENYMINYKNFYKNNSKINEKIKKEKLKKGIGNSYIESITSIFDINQGTFFIVIIKQRILKKKIELIQMLKQNKN